MKKRWGRPFLCLMISICIIFAGGCAAAETGQGNQEWKSQVYEELQETGKNVTPDSAEEVPQYKGDPYIVIDENEPGFTEEEITDQSFESYSELDSLGRCGQATASVGKNIMPTQKERESAR